MELLTDSVVEAKLLERVQKKASTYGQEIGGAEDVICTLSADSTGPSMRVANVLKPPPLLRHSLAMNEQQTPRGKAHRSRSHPMCP